MNEQEHGAIVPPPYLGVAHELPSLDEGAAIFEDPSRGYAYARMGNPTVRMFEEYARQLEGGERAWATSSGLAALQLLILGICEKNLPEITCICTSSYLYGGSIHQLRMWQNHLGIDVTFIENPHSLDAWETTMHQDTLIFLETPANPNADVFDIEAIADIAQKCGAYLVVDNTLGVTLQKPLELGADAVLHSATKHIVGNSGGLGGVLVGNEGFVERYGEVLTEYLIHLGIPMHPLTAWLALQNRASLPLQMERLSNNAERIALFLEEQPGVIRVNYPGRSGVLKGGGGVLSFDLGDYKRARAFVEAQTTAILAPHLGDVNTYLIIHPASTTHSKLSQEELAKVNITPGLVRLSVALEDPYKRVIPDFERALKAIA